MGFLENTKELHMKSMTIAPLISIIIPVYKVEEYLDDCVQSVINQTYKNLEIILVDDGSPDNCPQICDRYSEEDPRIKVIHKKNGGLSDARNAGIQLASGEYIGFVDSDDWIDKDMYEVLLDAILEHSADISEIGITYCFSDRTIEKKANTVCVLNRQETITAFLDRTLPIQGCVVGKLYCADIVKKVLFPVNRLHEDGFFTYKALYEANKYVLLDVCKYNYRQERQGSIMTTVTKQNPKSLLDVIDAFEERISFFKDRGEGLLAEKAEAYYYKTLVSEYRASCAGKYDSEICRFLRTKIETQNVSIMKNKQLGFWKAKYWVFYLLMHLSNKGAM